MSLSQPEEATNLPRQAGAQLALQPLQFSDQWSPFVARITGEQYHRQQPRWFKWHRAAGTLVRSNCV
jgi:hypothetical protein